MTGRRGGGAATGLPGGALLAVMTLWGFSGCSSGPAGTPIARVGDAVLTLEAARAAIDTTSADSEERLSRYVAGWVNAELLYQEAVRRGIDAGEEFEAKIGAVRKQLASEELLEQTVFGRDTSISPDTLRAYFDGHRDEFTLTEDHLKLRLMTFRGRESARRFAALAGAKKSWQAAADSIASDPRMSGEVLSATPETWFTRETLYPPELWKVASPLVPNEISFPFKTESGYTVLQVVSFAPAGKTGEFELAEGEIRDRIRIERGKAGLEALLGTLRERFGVEMMMNDVHAQQTRAGNEN